jgi:preprotein translocase subunit SecD
VITAPVINEEIGGGQCRFLRITMQEATDIAPLRAGALAAPMEIIRAFVGPSMGEENIKRAECIDAVGLRSDCRG